MICQHCQTRILDDEHRCPRCGRRVRGGGPSLVAERPFPISASATAPAYDWSEAAQAERRRTPETVPERDNTPGQQPLFESSRGDSRVIPFDSLTSQTERESIRARAATLPRPTAVKAEKVEVRRPRQRKTEATAAGQHAFDFRGADTGAVGPQSEIVCDATVARASGRLHAGLVDGFIILSACGLIAAAYSIAGGEFTTDKHLIGFLALPFAAVPVIYNLLWALAGQDTIGMRAASLRLVNFDGNPPSRSRRYQRVFGQIVGSLAAWAGWFWMFVDADSLAWHDHISGTFPARASEKQP